MKYPWRFFVLAFAGWPLSSALSAALPPTPPVTPALGRRGPVSAGIGRSDAARRVYTETLARWSPQARLAGIVAGFRRI